MGSSPVIVADIIAFWNEAGPDRWWVKDDAFDRVFSDRFLDAHMAAARRECDSWLAERYGALALLILLDQFPRNCFRGSGHMYATDQLARRFALSAIEAGHDMASEPELRVFFYTPLMHSEHLTDQDRCVSLCAILDDQVARSAREHREIIASFGRFPHRNPMLGRITTAQERQFLAAGGFSG